MPVPDKRQPREILIFDTGAIRELVLYSAVHRYKFESRRADLRFFRDRDSYDNCGQFIAPFRRKTTSASVVSELAYWIRQTFRGGNDRIWNLVYEEFRGMRMDEEVIQLLEMPIGTVVQFGPTDASLLEMARLHAAHSPGILTIDRKLRAECERAQIRSWHVEDVLWGP
jgi:hypothetical protein